MLPEKIISRSYKKSTPHLILTKLRYSKPDQKNIDFPPSYGLAHFWPKIFKIFFWTFVGYFFDFASKGSESHKYDFIVKFDISECKSA